jgi:hypothetical protein
MSDERGSSLLVEYFSLLFLYRLLLPLAAARPPVPALHLRRYDILKNSSSAVLVVDEAGQYFTVGVTLESRGLIN